MRKFWTVVHRWVGLATAICLFVAGFSGALIAFHAELDGLLNPDLLRVEARSTPRLDIDALAETIERALPEALVGGFTVSRIPTRSVTAFIEGRVDPATGNAKKLGLTEAFVDPYDGRYLGARETGKAGIGPRQLMSFVYSLHTSMHLPGAWGVWLMGLTALLWFFDNFVGAYLTFPSRHRRSPERAMRAQRHLPKSWWSRWKPAWLIKTSGSAYRVMFDSHRAPGLWLWLVLGVLALSSVYLNLQREVFNPILGLISEVTPFPGDFPKTRTEPKRISFGDATSAARNALPANAQDLNLSMIGYDRETNVFRVVFGWPDTKNEWFKLQFENVYLDGTTGGVVARFGDDTANTAGDKFTALLFPLHSGQIFGLAGRILICITGLAISVLSVTGVLIWWRKRAARVSVRRKAEPSGQPAPAE